MTPDMHIRHVLIDTLPRQKLIELIAAHIRYSQGVPGGTPGPKRSPREWYAEVMKCTKREGLA